MISSFRTHSRGRPSFLVWFIGSRLADLRFKARWSSTYIFPGHALTNREQRSAIVKRARALLNSDFNSFYSARTSTVFPSKTSRYMPRKS
jgi:hypothetical protein